MIRELSDRLYRDMRFRPRTLVHLNTDHYISRIGQAVGRDFQFGVLSAMEKSRLGFIAQGENIGVTACHFGKGDIVGIRQLTRRGRHPDAAHDHFLAHGVSVAGAGKLNLDKLLAFRFGDRHGHSPLNKSESNCQKAGAHIFRWERDGYRLSDQTYWKMLYIYRT